MKRTINEGKSIENSFLKNEFSTKIKYLCILLVAVNVLFYRSAQSQHYFIE